MVFESQRYDRAAIAVHEPVAPGESPEGVGRWPDGIDDRRAYSVSVIDTSTKKKLTDIKVGKTPWGVLVPEGH